MMSLDYYSFSRSTRVSGREIRAQKDTYLHREYDLAMKNISLRRDARAAQRKVPAELARSPAARTPDGVLDFSSHGKF